MPDVVSSGEEDADAAVEDEETRELVLVDPDAIVRKY